MMCLGRQVNSLNILPAQTLAVFLWQQKPYAAASPAPPAYADHMTGDG